MATTATLTPADIPAERWDTLAAATGSDITAQGETVIAVAAFVNDYPGLSLRDMADYMKLHYAAAALSHTTLGQHRKLMGYLAAAIAAPVLTPDVVGKARKVFGTTRYSWERWEAVLGWAEVSAATDSGERSAMAIRAIDETYTAAATPEAKAEAETLAKAEAEARKLKAAESKAAKVAEREEELKAATAAADEKAALLADELSALRGSQVTVDGSAESWERFTALAAAFLPYAASMPRATGAALAALMSASTPPAAAPKAAPVKAAAARKAAAPKAA